MLIAVLHLTRQREGLAGNLPGSFPGAKPPRPRQAPQVSPLPMPAEHHGQFLGMQRTLHLDSLAHAFATRYLHTLRPPAPLRQPRTFPQAGLPTLELSLIWRASAPAPGAGGDTPHPHAGHGGAGEPGKGAGPLWWGRAQRRVPRRLPPATRMPGGDLFYAVWLVPD